MTSIVWLSQLSRRLSYLILSKAKLWFWSSMAVVVGLAALYFRGYRSGKRTGSATAAMETAKSEIKAAVTAGDTEALRRITLELLK